MDYITEKELNKDTGISGKSDDTKPGYIALIIDEDGTGSPWEGGINGTFYRITRGVPVKVPENLVKLIRANSNVLKISESELQEYTSANGKKLG